MNGNMSTDQHRTYFRRCFIARNILKKVNWIGSLVEWFKLAKTATIRIKSIDYKTEA